MLHGEIKPIIKNKNKDHTDPNNYRPIMNSCNLLKLFEYCLLPFLNKYIHVNSHQFGFRRQTGCISAITVLKETVLNYTSSGSKVHCAMIDLSKAFDKVNHKILIMKMMEAGMPPLLVRIFKYMMENVYVNVSVGGHKGDDWLIKNGTRQGGILSPHIFNFYINNMIGRVSSCDVGCRIGIYRTNIICYADDILLCAPSVQGLQFLVNYVCDILNDLCLPLNDKSSYIVFRNRRTPRVTYTIDVLTDTFENINECKYLGAILTDDFRLDEDLCRSSSSFLRQFNSIFHKFSFLNVDVLSFLIQSYCFSFYGSELWYNFSNKRVFNKISVAYHKAIKRVAGLAPWQSNHAASDITHLPIFSHFINSKILSHLFSLIQSVSPCIIPLKYYFRFSSFILKHSVNTFRDTYNVNDILDNDFKALKAGIFYTQQNEERSFYMISK